jgi:hypothetical protein
MRAERDSGCQVLISYRELRCQGCGSRVKKLSMKEARMVRGQFVGCSAPARAFQCDTCEVIIYQDEFIDDQFVPHQFRHLFLGSPLVDAPAPRDVPPNHSSILHLSREVALGCWR